MERNQDRENSAPVVVAGLYLPGVDLLQSFDRRGVRVIGIDSDRSILGFHSRRGEKRVCPDPAERPEAWLDFMLDLGRRIGSRSVLLATSDRFVVPIETYGDALAECYVFPRPAGALNVKLTGKWETLRLAAEHGFPVSKTCWPQSEEDLSLFAREAEFPCLIKPEFSKSWARAPELTPVRGG